SGSKPSISTSEPVGTSAGRSSYWSLCPHYIWPNPTRRTVNKDQFAAGTTPGTLFSTAWRSINHVLYSIRTTVKAKARNAIIKAKKKCSEAELIPQLFCDYYKKMLCTHVWDKCDRGDGLRTGHRGRSTGCGIVLCATVARCPESLNFRIKTTKHNRAHNHRLKKEFYDHYPVNRRVTDPDALGFVYELVKAGGKPKKILKYLQDTTGDEFSLEQWEFGSYN
ncbi:hypothetical protein JG688_00009270, partial [Phytophthora aleatoria]